MIIGIALVNDIHAQNMARKIAFQGAQNYGIDNESLYMVPHVSLKQSFPFGGDMEALESYFETFFSAIEPVDMVFTGINLVERNPSTGILWFDIAENPAIRDIHNRLCRELKDLFGISPVGFDGEEWRFHSTIVYSKSGTTGIEALFGKYREIVRPMVFKATEAVMFCHLNDSDNIKEIFTYRNFKLGCRENMNQSPL